MTWLSMGLAARVGRGLANRAWHSARTQTRAAFASLPEDALQVEGKADGLSPWHRLTVIPVLQGRVRDGPNSGHEAAEAIRACAPNQVLVELCAARYADVVACGLLGMEARPPSRMDILGNIHGGLLAHELVPVLLAAREVGAAVVPIDRPQAATRSRVGQRLWHPRLVQGLLQYGGESVRRRSVARFPQDAEALNVELERLCLPAHQVLVDERCNYMAHQVRASVTRGANVVLVCGTLHCGALVEMLRHGRAQDVDLARLARRTVPTWPLYVVTYAVIPAAVAAYAALGAWHSFLVPVLFPPDDGPTL